MAQTFVTQIRSRFRDADPAGFLFYARTFELAHDAYEDFVISLGFTWKQWFKSEQFLVPLRQAEADYFAPIWPGEELLARVSLTELKETSFVLQTEFIQNQKVCATVKTIHVFLDKKTQQKMSIPNDIRKKLEI